MFHSTKKSRRLRNPQQQEENKQPFFSKKTGAPTQSQPFFQAKLTVGQPGDKYEQEADQVANKIVNGNGQAPVVQRQEVSAVQKTDLATPVEDEKLGTAEARMEKDKMLQEKPDLQKQEAEEEEPVQMQEEEEESLQMQEEEEEEEPLQMQEEEEEPVQMQEEEEESVQMQEEEEESLQMQEEEEEEMLQPKSESPTPAQAGPNVSSRIETSAGNGKPLPGKNRAEMETAFGVDFSDVHIHTDSESEDLTQSLGAQAFTHGKDIYFNSGKFNPEHTAGKRLLAHELTHVVQQKGAELKRKESGGVPSVQREMELTPAGVPTGNYLFRTGNDLSSGFFSRVKRFTATGTLTDDQLNELRLYSLARRGSVTHVERLLMAAGMEPANLPLIQAHRRGALSIPIANISSANREHVSNIGRESMPANVTTLILRAMMALSGGNIIQSIELFAEADEAAIQHIFEIGGERWGTQAADLVAFIEIHHINAASVLSAMLNAASDSSTGDQIMAGIVFATAAQAGHATASQIASGAIKVDALIPRAFEQYTGGGGAEAFYSTAAITDRSKGDTVYVPTNMDVMHVAHRALIIHELTHAQDDAAATGVTTVPQIDFEIRAYRRQVKYVMDQLLAAPADDQAWLLSQAADMVDAPLFQWAFLLEAKSDLTRYQTIVSDILTQSASVSAGDVTAGLALSEADLLTRLRNAILALPMYSATAQTVTEGLSGESVLDHIN